MFLKIAVRNLRRQRRRTVLTLLTMAGGFILAAFSIGWSDGSYAYVINMFTCTRLGHIQVHAKGYLDKPSLYTAIADPAATGTAIGRIRGVSSWTPRVYGAGLISLDEKSAGVRIIGIDPRAEHAATSFDKRITAGAFLPQTPGRTILLGAGLAAILKAGIGAQIVLVSQAADGSMANALFNVGGIVESGDALSDRSACYLHIDTARDFVALGRRAHEIVVITENIDRVGTITAAITAALGNPELSVEPWQEFAQQFYEAMRVDERGTWIMLVIIMLIVAIGVLNTVLMSVLERRREYGLLKALGTRPAVIVAMVMAEVGIMAALSIVVGSAIALVVNYALSITGIALPFTFTYGGVEFSRMYTEINLRSFYIPAVTVLLTAAVVGFVPALRAARSNPAVALRTF